VIYVLWENQTGPMVAHTTEQGATAEMAGYSARMQAGMQVAPIHLVDDHDD
jgi:hypothetical protein